MNTTEFIPAVNLDARKLSTLLEILLTSYFDSPSPNLNAISYDYQRIQTILSCLCDYSSDILTLTDPDRSDPD